MGSAPVLAAGLQRWVPGSTAQLAEGLQAEGSRHMGIPPLQLLRRLLGCASAEEVERGQPRCPSLETENGLGGLGSEHSQQPGPGTGYGGTGAQEPSVTDRGSLVSLRRLPAPHAMETAPLGLPVWEGWRAAGVHLLSKINCGFFVIVIIRALLSSFSKLLAPLPPG